ncbi:MAG: YIP1 family protein [Candidatus Thorarchaeota archaeon]
MRRCEFCDSPVPADATICPVCKEEIAEETLERILPLLKRPDAPDVREMGVKDRLWGVLRRPAAAYRDIGRRPDAAGPMLIILANALVLVGFFLAISSKFTVTVTINVTSGQTADVSVLGSAYGPQVLLAGLATVLPYMMLGMFYLIIGGAFAHLAFKITGGTGGKQKSVAIVGYAMLPVVLIRVAAIVVILTTLPTFDANLASQYGLIIDQIYMSDSWRVIDWMTVGAFFWTGFLLIFGIREAHDTSTMWAALVSLACMIVLIWTFWQVH